MLDKGAFLVQFPDSPVAEASQFAVSLREDILDHVAGAQAEVRRADQASMNVGETLAIVLGSPAVVALAHVLRSFMTRANCTRMDLVCGDCSVSIRNAKSGDLAEIVQAVSKCVGLESSSPVSLDRLPNS
jgi:hypothetical protein